MTLTYNGASENLLGSIRYPDTKSASGTLLQNGYTVTYTYDLMGRQTGMTYDTSPSDGVGHVAVNSATYNAANQLGLVNITFASGQPLSQGRTYNSLNQLESVLYNGATGLGYEYVGGQNNGQLSVLHDYIGARPRPTRTIR